MYGNVPDLDDPVDGLLYGGKLALDGLGGMGAGQIGLAAQQLVKAGWKYSFSKASGRIVTKAGPSMVDDGLNIATFEFRASKEIAEEVAKATVRQTGKEGAKLLPQGMVPNAGGKIVSYTTEKASTFYRVFSGNPNGGAFLTKAPPKSSAFVRQGLALPSNNAASYVQKVTVPRGVTLQRSRALSAFGKRGGLEQYQILNYDSRIIFHKGMPLK